MRLIPGRQGIICFLVLTFYSVPSGAVEKMGTGFTAPQVNNKTNVYSPITGDIVYDSFNTLFYGYDHTGNWQSLGVGAGATTPAGVVSAFAGSSVPAGYLLCDGSAISRTTYSTLFTTIGTTYGSGDGSTTFNLPNAQGVFLRGDGSQTISSITYTGTQGTTQGDQMQGHIHPETLPNATAGGAAANPGSYLSSNYTNATPNSTAYSGGANTSNPASDGTNGTPRIGAETRPANISVKYIIKY